MKRLRGCQLLTLMLPIWELKHTPMLPTPPSHHPLPLSPSLPPPFRSIHSSRNPRGAAAQPAHAALQETTRGCGSAWNREAIYFGRISADWLMCWLESWLHAPRAEAPPALWAISPWPALPPFGPPAPQPTTSSNAPMASHSHPPAHSNQTSSLLYFCLYGGCAT